MDAELLETVRVALSSRVALAIAVISLWGAAGSLITYSLGRQGLPAVQSKFHQLDPAKLKRVENWYDRWGNRLLFISMIPVLGTMIRLGAGIYGIRLATFLLWTFAALLVRNWVLFLVAHGVIQTLF